MENEPKWFQNKQLTRVEAIQVQYELTLMYMIIKDNPSLFKKADMTIQEFPPIKERIDATMAYVSTLPGNPYGEIEKLSREAQIYALTQEIHGDLKKDKSDLEDEFFLAVTHEYLRRW